MARPRKVSDKQLIEGVSAYLESVQIPIVAEYANLNGITRQTLYKRMDENPLLFDAIKRINDRKEIVLERGALTGKLQPTMAIFSLKQMGWRDKFEAEVTTETVASGVIQIAPVLERESNGED